MNHINKICISCGYDLSDDIVIIGKQYPSAVFISENHQNLPHFEKSSLNLSRCRNPNCCLVQLTTKYDLKFVFDNYPYESGKTATMNQVLMELLDSSLQKVLLCEEDVVLDIGGNDGTLLSMISTPLKARVNIDAAADITQVLSEKDTDYIHVHSLFSKEAYQKLNLPPPKLITSIAMFYHLSDPVSFCKDVVNIMSDETVWVLQMTYLGTMLENNIFDNIVHEHVAYYSLKSLEFLLKQLDLTIADAEIVPSYGGSLRVYIVKNEKAYHASLWRKNYLNVENYEIKNLTNSMEALYAFNCKIQLLKSTLKDLIKFISASSNIWGFGASTKGNMILQFLDMNSKDLQYILDNSDKKIGKKTSGSLISIIDEAKNIKNIPNYLLVLPYYYTEAFKKIIQKNISKGKTINLIIPLPHPHMITVEGQNDN